MAKELAKIALATTALFHITEHDHVLEQRLYRNSNDTGYRTTEKKPKDRAKIKAARKQRNRK